MFQTPLSHSKLVITIQRNCSRQEVAILIVELSVFMHENDNIPRHLEILASDERVEEESVRLFSAETLIVGSELAVFFFEIAKLIKSAKLICSGSGGLWLII